MLARLQPVGVHGQTHGATGRPPLESGCLESRARGIDKFITIGLCWGADNALRTCCVEPRVIGAGMIDFYAMPSLRYLTRLYSRRLLSARAAQQRGALLVDLCPLAGVIDPSQFDLAPVPTAAQRLALGCDAVVLDGAGLLGGPECGVIAGTDKLLDRIVSGLSGLWCVCWVVDEEPRCPQMRSITRGRIRFS